MVQQATGQCIPSSTPSSVATPLATLKAEKHRIQVPEECGNRGGRLYRHASTEKLGNQYGNQALEHVTEQRDSRCFLPPILKTLVAPGLPEP